MTDIIKSMMHLVGSAINVVDFDRSSFEDFSCEQVKTLFKLSKYHDIAHLVSYSIAVNKICLPDCDDSQKLKKRHAIAALRYETANYDLGIICDLFEKEKIEFVPLKGSVLRDYYPEPWMRTSCDIDVLVHEEDLDRAIELLTEKCGYTFKEKGTHDVSLFSPGETHLELHFRLSEELYSNTAGGILESAWEYASPKEGHEYLKVFTNEFFYLYHIYHMAKHFEVAGCGIKPYLDLYILDKKVPCDADKQKELLKNSGLLKFAECCRRMNECWFENAQMDETMRSMQEYIISGGTYGNRANGVAIRQSKSGGKLKYIFERLFLPYDMLKVHYPVLKKHKYLTPVFEVVRWLKLLSPSTIRRSKQEIEYSKNVSDSKNDKLVNLIKEIGLK